MSGKIRLLLRDLRQAHELSQEELAHQLGISRQSVISLERGEYLPSTPILVSLIEFFNCPIDRLIDGVNIQRVSYDSNQIEKGGEQPMQLTPWNPLQAIDQMHEEMNGIVERTFGRGDWSRALSANVGAMNVHENDAEYEIEMQVPGLAENDISLEVSDNMLTVSGKKKAEEKKEDKSMVRREWQHSEFSRSIRFAAPVQEDKVEAKLENGTLTITAPKVEPIRPKVKKIEVKKR